jgi:signal transduction histidine kinase
MFLIPGLTLWESHAITIVFSSLLGVVATAVALRRQDGVHRRLQIAEAGRQTLERESSALRERGEELARTNQRLVLEIDERRRLEGQLAHAQKMESIGRLAGGIAHDFNNYLSVIINGIELVQLDLAAGADVAPDLTAMRDASERAAGLTRQLLQFARHQPHAPRRTDVHRLLGESRTVLQRLAGAHSSLEIELQASATTVRIDPTQLEQVLFNLVANASDASPPGGRIVIATQSMAFPPEVRGGARRASREAICIAVRDEGGGIAADVLDRVFEPFFTTKPIGKGTGLGLATSYGIVTRAGGEIEATNRSIGGAEFRVILPVELSDAETDDAPVLPAAVRRSGTVLLAEDEAAVRDVTKRLLERRGFRVIEAADGEEAVARALEHGEPIDLLLTGVVMPRLNGPDTARALRRAQPTLPVVFMSGYTDVSVVSAEDESAFLQKPFTSTALMQHVEKAMGW